MKLLKAYSLSSLFLVTMLAFSVMANQQETEPTVEIGARVYQERCVLCHGMQAMGEGILPMKLKDYPNTNLLKRIRQRSREEIHRVVTHGASLDNISDFMPPMGAELSWTELESVVDFLMLLKTDTPKSLNLLKDESDNGSQLTSVFAR
ncbi:c-type cytochrome [Alteromonas gracilis]|uniref:c-type cytochrome n=1 Tax=Alteromonas gracilis TaxID=1479524 RepID=UPI00321A62AE